MSLLHVLLKNLGHSSHSCVFELEFIKLLDCESCFEMFRIFVSLRDDLMLKFELVLINESDLTYHV